MLLASSPLAAVPLASGSGAAVTAAAITLTAPSPSLGLAGVPALGGVLLLTGGSTPVAFVLSATPAAVVSPSSGVLQPGVPVAYFIRAPAAGAYTINTANGGGLANPPAVAFTAALAQTALQIAMVAGPFAQDRGEGPTLPSAVKAGNDWAAYLRLITRQSGLN